MNVSFNCARSVKESLTFDHPQVHDHFLVVEDAIDVHPAAVRPAVRPPHIQDVQVHLPVQDVPGQPVPVLHLQHQGQGSITTTLILRLNQSACVYELTFMSALQLDENICERETTEEFIEDLVEIFLTRGPNTSQASYWQKKQIFLMLDSLARQLSSERPLCEMVF